MKKLFTAILGIILLGSCQKKEVTLNLTVKDKTIDSVAVYLADKDTLIGLDANGKGSVTLSVADAQYGVVKYKWKKSPVYLEPGQDQNITWDMTPSELTIEFDGEFAEKNSYMNGPELKGPVMADYGRSEEDLMKQLEEYVADNYKVIDSKNFDKTFAEREKIRIQYWVYGILWQYIASNGIGSEEAYNKLTSLVKEEDWLLPITYYTSFMKGYISIMANKGKVVKNVPSYNKVVNVMEYAAANLNNQKVKDYIIGSAAIEYLSVEGVDKIQKIKKILDENVKDPIILKSFDGEYGNMAVLAKGSPSPDFKMASIDGKEYTLADFKGRYIYIDLWATWCAPCQGELPKLQLLEEAFAGTNIAFVSMSIDKDKEKWEKQVKDQKLGGFQLYAGVDSKFTVDYKIKGIPHFILIDPEGNIVDANMTRPSDEKTVEMLGMVAEPLK